MAFLYEKETGDIVVNGWEKGIAASPHQGIANIQNANIATEMGEVMVNYARFQQNQIPIVSGTILPDNSSALIYQGTTPLVAGTWFTINTSTITNLTAATSYFVFNVTFISGTTYTFQIATLFGGPAVSSLGLTGTATGTTINLGLPALGAKAKENYNDTSNNLQTRYYVMDVTGKVWVQDTGNTTFVWGLIDTALLTSNLNAGGLAVYQGNLHAIVENYITTKETTVLGNSWVKANTGNLNTLVGSKNPHTAITSAQNFLAYCDSNYIGTITASPNSQSSTTPNVWSYGAYTFSTITLTLTNLIGGNFVVNGQTISFFTPGTLPSGIANNTTIYFVINVSTTTNTFSIAATPGGSAISLSGGSGTQYFNSYDPIETTSGGPVSFVASRYNTTLPAGEISQCLAEIGTDLIVGCRSNILYIVDEANAIQATGKIATQENNTTGLQNVNNNVYVFQGVKGNVSITNGAIISPVISVPDYVTSQIEPYFTFGDREYIRGRVFFSIKDSNNKTGAVWSFIPTQNAFPQQDIGISLRLENQNSYGTYAGDCPIILSLENQNARGTQYFTAWDSGTSNFGIDASSTLPYTGGQTVIETDAIPTGSFLTKKTFKQLEYKLAQPLVAGESVQINYRTNIGTGTAYTSPTGSVVQDPANPLSGYFVVDFEKSQWLQLQVILTSTATNPSYVRLTELRIR